MKEATKDNWERWYGKDRQIKKAGTFYSHIIEEVRKAKGTIDGLKVLEIGAGKGHTSIGFAKEGADVIALDYSTNAVEIMKREMQKYLGSGAGGEMPPGRMEVCQADATNMPFPDGSFDVVFHQGLLEHFNAPETILKEQHRALKEGGLLLVQVPQRYTLMTPLKHALMAFNRWPYGGWETEFGVNDLGRLLEDCGFEVKRMFGYGSFTLAVLKRFGLMNRYHLPAINAFHEKLRCRYCLEIVALAVKAGKGKNG